MLRVAETGDIVDFEGEGLIINESDEYALEEAIVLKKKIGGLVTAITVGSVRSLDVLYLCIAKGADKAIRIDAGSANPDSYATARLLATVIKDMKTEIVMTGLESFDNMSSQVGVCIAEIFGWPCTTSVTSVDFVTKSKKVKVKRELGSGLGEVAEMPLPAVLCIQSGITNLTYTSHLKKLQAMGKGVKVITLQDIGLDERSVQEMKQISIDKVFEPEQRNKTEIISGTPLEAGRRMMEKIAEVLRRK